MKKYYLLLIGFSAFQFCTPKTSLTNDLAVNYDSVLFAKSKVLVEKLYKSNCANCHKPTQLYTGPTGEGVMSRVSFIWYKNFVKSPSKMMEIGETYSMQLKEYWRPVIMSSFPMLDDSTLFYLYVYQNNGSLIDSSRRKATFSDNQIEKLISEYKTPIYIDNEDEYFSPLPILRKKGYAKRTSTKRTTSKRKQQ